MLERRQILFCPTLDKQSTIFKLSVLNRFNNAFGGFLWLELEDSRDFKRLRLKIETNLEFSTKTN